MGPREVLIGMRRLHEHKLARAYPAVRGDSTEWMR